MTDQELLDMIIGNTVALNGVAGATYQDAQAALGKVWKSVTIVSGPGTEIGNFKIQGPWPAHLHPDDALNKLYAFADSGSPEGTPMFIRRLKSAIYRFRECMAVTAPGVDFGDPDIRSTIETVANLHTLTAGAYQNLITQEEKEAFLDLATPKVLVPIEKLKQINEIYRDQLISALNGV